MDLAEAFSLADQRLYVRRAVSFDHVDRVILYLKSTSSKIVDRSFVQIGVKYERLLQVDLRHQELCNLKASYSHYPDIERYFSSLMDFAPANVLELSLQSQCFAILPLSPLRYSPRVTRQMCLRHKPLVSPYTRSHEQSRLGSQRLRCRRSSR